MRHVVRAILLTPRREVLLMQMAFPWYERSVWIAPGGGLDPEEDPRQGLLRELAEETGNSDLSIGPQVGECALSVEHEGRLVRLHERYYLVPTNRFEPIPQAFEDHEKAWFREFRWWSMEALASDAPVTSPDTLSAMISKVVAGRSVAG
jgi:ADP-ribose pyrophosphatase YjhB (NUDIX family)